VAIDDLQWADADSLALLGELMRTPGAPPLLLLATLRDGGDGPAEVRARLDGDTQLLPVPTLGPAEACQLAAELLGQAAGEGPLSAAVIAAEAHGHPLFIDELVRHKLTNGASLANPPLQLDDALGVRVDRLDADARRLLELVATAGAPLTQATAAAAAAIDFSSFCRLAAQLKGQNLVRTGGVRPSDPVEPYHDRVREAVLRRLEPAVRQMRHGRLAMALEASRQADAQRLAWHFAEAGDLDRAASYTSLAAEEAARALAFDRAATLYREALGLSGPAAQPMLAAQLAEALANAGRGADAARAYERAASLWAQPLPPDATAATALVPTEPVGPVARTAMALDLQRRAAEQYLRGGHVDQGLVAVHKVLAAVGLSMPRTPLGALASLLYHRARVRLRGLDFRERPESEVPLPLLRRLDSCFSVAVGMGLVDTIRGADFQSRCMLLALRAGEPHRVARALAFEAAHSSAAGQPARARTAKLGAAAAVLAKRLASPELDAVLAAADGVVAFLEGRWRQARERCDEAMRLFRDRCIGAAWETDSAQAFGLWALFSLGEMAELRRRVPQAIREAEARGDLYAATNLRVGELNFVHLLDDDVAAARTTAATAARAWSRQGFHHQHWDMLLAEATIDLYAGDAAAAWARVERTWPALGRSLLLMIQLTRIEAWHLRGRAALALALVATGDERRRALHEAARAARRLVRERADWSRPLGLLVEAGVRRLRGDEVGAAAALRRALGDLEAADMALWAAACRVQLGALVGGDEGQALAAAGSAWLATQAIVRPSQVVATLIPGFA
jgi:eukaryotic-like serine/threonine-protein kinase